MAANNHERANSAGNAGAPIGWQAQKSASTRELIIEGIAALQQSMAPKVMEQHLSAFVSPDEDVVRRRVA